MILIISRSEQSLTTTKHLQAQGLPSAESHGLAMLAWWLMLVEGEPRYDAGDGSAWAVTFPAPLTACSSTMPSDERGSTSAK